MTVETKPFDVAEVLLDEERIAAYLEEAFADGDPAFIASAIGDVARARNITAIARDTGLTRETLYRAFSPGGNPTLATMAAVVKALGFQLSIRPLAR
ncbi:MAG TPA: addiction module antidote protein [Caulobacteraceae bacterium]|nr:addiction module antidote protein [Caulobacteraceae bacterium]